MSSRKRRSSGLQDVEETPRTMLKKLRSYPDTTEAKQRKVGLYKSPASSVRKSKSVMSRNVSPTPSKTPVEKTKVSTKATPAVLKSIKELKAATLELNEVTPQYPPTHNPVITPKSKRSSVTPTTSSKLNEVTPQYSPTRSPVVTPKSKRSSVKPTTSKLNEVTPQYLPTHSPVVTSKSKRSSVTPTTSKLNEVTPQYSPTHSPVVTPKSKRSSVKPSNSARIAVSIKTKSSLRSFTKSGDGFSRRVSFGPVREYHPDDSKPEDKMIKVESETIQNSLDTIDEGLVSDESLTDEESDEEVVIPTFDQVESKSPLLDTPPLLSSRSPKPSHRTRPHPRTSKKRMPTIPISFTKKQFCLFARKKLTKEAAQVLVQSADDFIEYISKELEVYALHAKRKTINLSDVILLMKREKLLTGNETFSSLANKYMCHEHVSEIVPCVEVLSMKP